MTEELNGCNDQTNVFGNGHAVSKTLADIEAQIVFTGEVEYAPHAFPSFNHGLPHPLLMQERAEAIQAAKDLKQAYAEDIADLVQEIDAFNAYWFRRWLEVVDGLLAAGLKPSDFLGGDEKVSVGA